MKTSLYIIALLLLLTACKKDHQTTFESHGTLTGYDYATCATCGGIKITIANDTTKNPPPFYRIGSSLMQLGIPESTPFPINVELNWQHVTTPIGNSGYITVSAIQVIK
jgi:hypothetical protein